MNEKKLSNYIHSLGMTNEEFVSGVKLEEVEERYDEKMTEIYANYINKKRFDEALKVNLEVI